MSVFNEQGFEKKLLALKDSQDSISTLSDWCLQNRQHHKKIVSAWLHVLKRVKVESRLTLFYLANDVIQYSKRKNYDFVESWGTALQKATTMVRDEKVIQRILRIFKIWGDRNVYDDAFLTDLRGLLTAKKATPATPVQPKQADAPSQTLPVAFEPPLLYMRINKCKELEDDTDLKLKIVNDCNLKLNDLDAFRKSLKDRRHADGVAGALDEAISQMEHYKKALEVEILERKAVIELLQQAEKFYETERGEAKIVFNAYRNFGSRVKSQKRKLDELIPTLASPIPSPDVNAPSPSPDSDIELPNDEDLSAQPGCKPKSELSSISQNSDLEDMPNCFSSFLGGGALPFDIQGNLFTEDNANELSTTADGEPEGKPIEVIGRRKEQDNFDITSFLKNLAQGSSAGPKANNSSSAIPGLGDPLPLPLPVPPPSIPSEYPHSASPTSAPLPLPLPPPPMPPNMFDREDTWNTPLPAKFPTWRDTSESNWSRDDPASLEGDWMPALPVAKLPPPPPLPLRTLETPESPPSFEKESNSFREPIEYDDTAEDVDVDHRLFAGHDNSSKDIDHRTVNNRFKKDVDHRNLISLTGSPGAREALEPPPMPPALWGVGDTDSDYRTMPLPVTRQQGQGAGGDIVESVDMEMSDDDDDHHRQKVKLSEELSGKRSGSVPPSKPVSPGRERDDLGKMKNNVKPVVASVLPRFPHPPPPRADANPPFPLNRFETPGIRPEFSNFPNNGGRFPPPPPGPPPGLPPSVGLGVGLGVHPRPHPRLPVMPLLPHLPPPPSIPSSLQVSPSSTSTPSTVSRSLSSDTTPATPPGPHGGTPTGNAGTASGPEESDTDSIGQYLNVGLSDDEDIKEIVASMDPQMLQEVVEGMNLSNPSEKIDNSASFLANGEVEDSDIDWTVGTEITSRVSSTPNTIRPWKNHGTPPMPVPLPTTPLSPGNSRYRGQSPNWRSPQMHDRGFSRGRWGFRPFRGSPRGGPRQPFGGGW